MSNYQSLNKLFFPSSRDLEKNIDINNMQNIFTNSYLFKRADNHLKNILLTIYEKRFLYYVSSKIYKRISPKLREKLRKTAVPLKKKI